MSKPTEEEKRICSPYCSIVTTPMLPSTVTMTCGWMHLLPPQPPAPSPHPPLTSTNAEAKTWGYFLNPDTRQIELPGKRIRGQICLLIQKRLPRRGIHKLECLTPIIPRVGVGGGGGRQSSRTEDLVAFYKEASLSLSQTTSVKCPETCSS